MVLPFMFVFMPLDTDAPVYYSPYGAIGLISVNIAIHLLQLMNIVSADQLAPFILQFGRINPLQWLTHFFLHLDLFHLAGNMIVLWSFALIVEGKLGLRKFLSIYLGLGVVVGALIQLFCLGIEVNTFSDEVPGAVGASAVVYGLMAISLIWAPRNELSCFLFLFVGFRVILRIVDVSVFTFAMFFIVIDLVIALFTGFEMSSQVGHITGAFVGLILGLALLQAKWVDCENWDLLSVWQGKHLLSWRAEEEKLMGILPVPRSTRPADERDAPVPTMQAISKGDEPRSRKRKPTGPWSEDEWASRLEAFRRRMEAGDAKTAYSNYQEFRQVTNSREISEKDLFSLGELLVRAGMKLEAIPVLERCVALAPSRSHRLRVLLAELVLDYQHRPEAALRVLQPISAEKLDDKWRTRAQQIAIKAQKCIEEKEFVAPEEWGDPVE